MSLLNSTLSDKKIRFVEFGLILITAILPLFFQHPFRINLFLAWEGAFRIANGEIPYRDFGSPVGYGFWLVPALFFKIFGASIFALLIVQAFTNIVSGLVFRKLLMLFVLPAPIRMLSVLVYCISYSMFNFWPWYNHLVFVVEIIGIYFLCSQLNISTKKRKIVPVVVSAFFVAFAFMTKQDTGALALCIALALLLFDAVLERYYKTLLLFSGAYVFFMALLIVPFLQYEFNYWFNLGQFPHYGRVDKFDMVNEFLGASHFIKLYLFFITAIIMIRLRDVHVLKENKNFFLFALLVLCILGQAAIIQVTSYTPTDGNIYFHSFAFAFMLFYFSKHFETIKVWKLMIFAVLIGLWWSDFFWNRFLRERVEGLLVKDKFKREQVISKRTFLLKDDTTKMTRSHWIVPELESFKRVKIPEGTAVGINKLMAMPEVKKKDFKMLNMSELTPLAAEMGYALEKGASYPLWFHKGVSFFDREVKYFCDRVGNQDYDMILFEDIPNVNQFYPYEVRACIQENYNFRFKFLAPRVPEFSYIEVYTKK